MWEGVVTRRRSHGWALASSVVALLVAVPAAQAQGFGIADWRAQVYDSNAVTEAQEIDANVFDQAGGHPYIGVTDFTLTGTTDDNVRNVRVDVPPGLVPNPDHAPRCAMAQLEAGLCPTEAQIGTERLTIRVAGLEVAVKVPLYNMEIEDDQVSRFGFNPADAASLPVVSQLAEALDLLHPVEIIGGVRDSVAEANPPGSGAFRLPADLGLYFTIRDTPATPAVKRSKLTFWGVPGAVEHSGEIGQSCISIIIIEDVCLTRRQIGPSPDPELPFLSNPTECAGHPHRTRLIVESHSGAFDSALELTPTIDGKDGPQHCEDVPFAPGLDVAPEATAADSPAGPEVTLNVPQQGLQDKDVLTTAHVRGVSVTLPPGMTINPSAANGLAACTDAQLEAGAGITGGDECPAASRIGTVEVSTPLLPPLPGQPDPNVDLTGSAFVGQPLPGDRYRLFLTIEGRGVSVRLKGSVRPDPGTGQLTAVFDQGNPQLPFDRLAVDFRDGPHAPLATPPTCGVKTATTAMTPYSGTPPPHPSDSFTIASGPNGTPCPQSAADRPFGPGFTAGLTNPVAASSSPLIVHFTRPDGHQELLRIDTILPEGVAAKLRGVPRCSEADANAGTCGPESKVGEVIVGAGAGPSPFFVPKGSVHLTGPYKGAPLGLSIKVPAQAGPFDLGNVIVRAAVHVDPATAQVSVKSDEVPLILEGIPLRTRDVRVNVNRSGFVQTPTSCEEDAVEATIRGTHDATAERSARFQATGCEELGFEPRFRFRAIGRKSTPRLAHPRLKTVVRPKPRGGANANISRTRVTLPRGIELDQSNVARPCTRPQFAAEECPERTKFGRAVAKSPLLDDPLRGPVYLVTSENVLPDLVADLNGIVGIDLRGRIDTTKKSQRIRTTFDVVPDVPVQSFKLNLRGGKRRGLLINSTDRCRNRRQNRIKVGVRAHNGMRADQRPLMKVRCAKQRRSRLARRIKSLRQRARRAARNDNAQRAKQLRQRAKRLQRRVRNAAPGR